MIDTALIRDEFVTWTGLAPVVTTTIHLLCDELDAARRERDTLVDGLRHALHMMDHLDEDDFRVRDLRHHLLGTLTDDNGKAMLPTKEKTDA